MDFLKEREDTNIAGTVAGGKAAAETNKKKYGKDFYANIGSIGGKRGHTGGFYANRELARTAGAIGGRKSRRGIDRKSRLDGLKIGDFIWDSCTPSEAYQRWYTPAARLGMKISVSAHGTYAKITRTA